MKLVVQIPYLIVPLALAAACSSRTADLPDAAAPARICPTPSLTPACNGQDGLGAPIPTCTADAPCQLLGSPGTTEITVPSCLLAGAAAPDEVRHWVDANGEDRYACVFTPPGAAAAPRALLVFFHGSHGTADDAYSFTGLRSKAASVDLSAAGARPGFLLASMQGRFLQWFGPNPSGTHQDYLYRDLASDSCNPDVRSTDTLIDQLVATGTVDAKRIYVAGWSNGAFFAQMYAIARHDTATPSGNHIAAAIAYAGGDPFANLASDQTPSCELSPYPQSSVPMYAIHRSCDALVPCDASQELASLPAGYDVESWMAAARSQVHDTAITDQIIDDNAAPAPQCAATCTEVQGTLNHLRWPDGQGNDGATDWEPVMLDFLRSHPHS